MYTYSYFCRIDKVVWRKDDLKLDVHVTLVMWPLVKWHSLAWHTADRICTNIDNSRAQMKMKLVMNTLWQSHVII